MDLVRAFQRLRRNFAQPKVAHLARFDELGHRSDSLFDRNGAVHTMLVIEIDRLHTEPLEAAFDSVAHVFRFAVDATRLGIFGIAHDAELGGYKDAIAV